MSYNPRRGIAIFAHYDRDQIIRDEVIYYLSGLNEVVGSIIFVSDSNLPDSELKRLNNLVLHSIAGSHGEYDFGSYKRGLAFASAAGILQQKEFCVFANDSCYAPLNPFKPLFDEMMGRRDDFWGFTENYFRYRVPCPHLQTYFLVFKKEVFLSTQFLDFFSSVKVESTKADIIDNYEVGLTNHLLRCGFSYSSFVPRSIKKSNLIKSRWIFLIIQYRSPFLKKSLIGRTFLGMKFPYLLLIRWVLRRYTTYPVDLL